MAKHSSATVRGAITHKNQTTRTATIMNALTRRAQAVLNDTSIDPQTRAIIRYGLETNDPWLAELVRRADAGERIVDALDFSQTAETQTLEPNSDDSAVERIEALAKMICQAGDEPGRKSAALLLLMAVLENSTHPKALANTAKHVAFIRCGEMNLYGMIDTQVAAVERELLAGVVLAAPAPDCRLVGPLAMSGHW